MANPFAETIIVLNSFSMFHKMPGNQLGLHTSISYLLIASKCILWKTFYCMLYNSPKALQLFYWILAFFPLLQIPHNNQGNNLYIVLNSMWIIIILVLPTHVQTNMPLNKKRMLYVHTRIHAHHRYTHVHEYLYHLLLLHTTTIKNVIILSWKTLISMSSSFKACTSLGGTTKNITPWFS
jgi:hypothetical protein